MRTTPVTFGRWRSPRRQLTPCCFPSAFFCACGAREPLRVERPQDRRARRAFVRSRKINLAGVHYHFAIGLGAIKRHFSGGFTFIRPTNRVRSGLAIKSSKICDPDEVIWGISQNVAICHARGSVFPVALLQ